MRLKIAIVLGSVREGRQGIKAAKFIVNKLKERNHEPVLIDPKEYDLPLLEKRYKDSKKSSAPKVMEGLSKIFRESDAVVVVSAEYNHSIPPALSNLLDHFFEEYFFKPSAIVSYSSGQYGGVRAAMQLRAMLGELGMSSIPSIFAIPKIQEILDEQGNAKEESLNKRMEKFLKELEWHSSALKEQRKKGLPFQ